MQLDAKDKRVLYELSKDASMPISKIAKEAGISRDSAEYRIKKLIRERIIKSFKLAVDYYKLGFQEYDIYFRLINVDEQLLQQIIKSFCENDFVTWVGLCFGKYELRISILAKDNKHLDKILSKMVEKYKDNIQDKEIVYVLKKFKLDAELLIKEMFPEIKIQPKIQAAKREAADNSFAPDDIDKKIILLLAENPRGAVSDIAKKVNLTPEAVRYRIKNLKKNKVIKGIYAIIDGNKLGYIWCSFLLKFSNLSKETEGKIESYVQNLKKATTAVRIMGRWDLGLTIYARNLKEAQQVLFNFKSYFQNIQDYETYSIIETYKYPAIAKGVFS